MLGSACADVIFSQDLKDGLMNELTTPEITVVGSKFDTYDMRIDLHVFKEAA